MSCVRDKILESCPDDNILHWSCINFDAEYGRDGEKVLRHLIEKSIAGDTEPSIVEIGTHYGAATAVFAEYGQVDTFDIVDEKLRSKVFWNIAVDEKRVRFHLMRAKTEIIEWCAKNPIDIAFIDGDHSYDAVKRDYDAVTQPNTGIKAVIFHDYKYNPAHTGNTVRFVNEIREGIITKIPPFAMWQPAPSGFERSTK